MSAPDRLRMPALGWVAELLRPKRAAIPWDLAVLSGIAIAVPVGVGMSTGNLGMGILASMGALIATMADRGGTMRSRVVRVVVGAVAAGLGMFLGALVLGNAAATIVLLMAAALVSGVAGVTGAMASFAGLQFMLYVVVGSGISFGPQPVWVTLLAFLTGAIWRLLLTVLAALALGRDHAPERVAVADVYRALSDLLAAAGTTAMDGARLNLTNALNTAYDTVVSARSMVAGRDKRYRTLMTLLNAATPVVEASVTVARGRRAVPIETVAALRQLAAAIENGTRPPELPPSDRSTPGRAALDTALRAVRALLNGDQLETATVSIPQPIAHQQPPSFSDRMLALHDTLASGAATWEAVIRLVLCVGVSETLSFVLPLERPYWITLTVAVVLKPDFGSVFARAVQRGLGTVVGVLLGTLVLVALPYGVPLVVALAVLAAMMPIAMRRNYGMLSTFVTPVIVILLELVHRGDEQLVAARVIDTVIGCAIVLLVGYLPWPSTWRSRRRIAEAVASVGDGVLAYFRVACGTAHGDRPALRRQTYRRLSDLRTLIQQTLAEPPPISTAAAAWWPMVVALERLTDAITSCVIRSERGGPAPSTAAIEQTDAALADLVEAIRSARPPRPMRLPDDDGLAGVIAELTIARSTLSMPAGDDGARADGAGERSA